jgi:pimeloyl-ACP methyl ester carboxylesterase
MRSLLAFLLFLPLVAVGPPPVLAQDAGGDSGDGGDASAVRDAVVGSWQGRLNAGGASLRLRFHVAQDDDGALTATMDSPDQGATGLPLSGVKLDGRTLTLRLPGAAPGTYRGTLADDGQTLEGTWRQSGQTFPLDLTRMDEADTGETGLNRPQHPEPPFPYDATDVTFTNATDGVRLAGTLTRPPGSARVPAVVLVSGSGPQDRDETILGHKPFLVLADHLTRRGVAVLRYDDRGAAASGGTRATATMTTFAQDAAAAVAFLAARDDIDAARIGVLGHSEGAVVASMLSSGRAGDVRQQVGFLVLVGGPALPGEAILKMQRRALAEASGQPPDALAAGDATQARLLATAKRLRTTDADSAAVADSLAALVRAQLGPQARDEAVRAQVRPLLTPWFQHFLTYDPRPALRQTDVPVLAVIGTKDLQVPADTNLAATEQALRAGGNDAVTTRALDGLNHLLQPATTGAPAEYGQIETTVAPEALDLIAGWVTRQTGLAPAE